MGVIAILMLLAFSLHLAVLPSVTMPASLTCVSDIPCLWLGGAPTQDSNLLKKKLKII